MSPSLQVSAPFTKNEVKSEALSLALQNAEFKAAYDQLENNWDKIPEGKQNEALAEIGQFLDEIVNEQDVIIEQEI